MPGISSSRPTAVVTGCAGGIGRVVCSKFEQAGFDVTGVDVSECSIPNVHTVRLDLADPTAIGAFCASYDRSVDALVNVAAVQVCKPFWELDVSEWDTAYNVNVRAVWLLCKHLKNKLQGGAVVNIASVHSVATSDRISAYASSKAALAGLTRNLAIEFAPFGTRVNAISPGAVDTPMLRDGLRRAVNDTTTFDDVWHAFNANHPLGSVGAAEDIAEMCLFLCLHKSNRFVTGSNIVVDGGVLARLGTE